MKSVRTNLAARCPACQSTLSAASGPSTGPSPGPGDITICLYCTLVCKFNDDLSVRALRPAELSALSTKMRSRITLYQRAIATMPRPKKE